MEIGVNNQPHALIESMSNICRLCLKQGMLQPLSDVHFSQYENGLSFFELLLDNKLPKNACANCLNEFNRIAEFIAKCKQSQYILNQIETECEKIKQNSNLKIEISDNFDFVNQETVEIKTEDVFEEILCTPCESGDFFLSSIDPVGEEASKFFVEEVKENLIDQRVTKEIKMCEKCGQIVTTTMKKHYKASKACYPRNFKCSLCGKAFKCNNKLKDHCLAHHWEGTSALPFMCHLCPKMFKYYVNLKRHLFNHENPKRFICEKCGKAYTTKIQMQDHINTHTGEKPFCCYYCGKTFSSRSSRTVHELQHKKQILPKVKLENSNLPAICMICNKEFIHNRALKLHLRSHNEVDAHKCKTCNEEFKSSLLLYHHSKTHTGSDLHPCPYCHKRFKAREYLTVHIRTHTGEKPFHCNLCEKKFAQRTHLSYHMLVHKGEKSFECQYCERAFALKGNLTVHMRLHTGERPYLCHVCKKGFCDSSSRKRHVRATHGEDEMNNIHNNFDTTNAVDTVG